MILQKKRATARVTAKELEECYAEWNSISRDEQLAFIAHREYFVKKNAGVFYDEAKEIKTSGSSTGLVKKYRWGPSYDAFFTFHYRLCFGQINHDGLAYVGLHQEPDCLINDIRPYGDTKLRLLSTGLDTGTNRDKILKRIEADFKAPIIWIMPSQLEIMIDTRNSLLTALMERYEVFHCTGEICSNKVVAFMGGKTLLDTMRVWNGGASFYTCKYGGLHWNTMVSHVETKDGNLIASDLWNCAQLFWKTDTGDRVEIHDAGDCRCGLKKQKNRWCEKLQVIELPNGLKVGYQALRRVFIETVADHLECSCGEVIDELLGVNFGVGDELHVLFEFKNDDRTLDIKKTSKISSFTGMKTVFRRGLSYGRFKNNRLFYLKGSNVEKKGVRGICVPFL